jgi:hypothetical protein
MEQNRRRDIGETCGSLLVHGEMCYVGGGEGEVFLWVHDDDDDDDDDDVFEMDGSHALEQLGLLALATGSCQHCGTSALFRGLSSDVLYDKYDFHAKTF